MKKSPKTLLFPVHLLEGKHYVGLAINFKEEFICYGTYFDLQFKEYNLIILQVIRWREG